MTANTPGEDTELVESAEVPPELDGKRLDAVCAKLFADYSRSRLQTWIEAGRVQARFQPTNLSQLTRELASNFEMVTSRVERQFHCHRRYRPRCRYVSATFAVSGIKPAT